MNVVQGTDVSALQQTVRFDLLKEAGHEFTFIRCKVGNEKGIDVRFAENVRRARGEGLYTAPYFFPFPLPHIDPLAQCAGFLAAAMVDGDPVGGNRGDLPPAYDLEWPPPEEWAKWKCTADQIVDYALAQCARIHDDYGIAPIIYSYPYFLSALSKAKNFASLMKYSLWLAGGTQYKNGNGIVPRRDDNGVWLDRAPIVPGWGDTWLFWQHDGDGGKRLPGSGVDADFNVFRFDSTALGQLAQAIEGPPPILVPDINTIHAMAANVMAEDALHAYRQERTAAIFADIVA